MGISVQPLLCVIHTAESMNYRVLGEWTLMVARSQTLVFRWEETTKETFAKRTVPSSATQTKYYALEE